MFKCIPLGFSPSINPVPLQHRGDALKEENIGRAYRVNRKKTGTP